MTESTSSRSPAQPVLSLEHASVHPLWEDLSFTLSAGEFLTVLGPSGVGKSTLLGTIIGSRRLTGGRVSVNGTLGYIPQQRMFDPELPLRARDLIRLSGAHGPFGRGKLSRARADEALAEVGMLSSARQRIGRLSGGQQQRVRHAQAIARRPNLLICDEPLLSLDIAAQNRMVSVIKRQATDYGAAVIFVTHSINPVLEATDRVLYLAPYGHRLGTVPDVMRSDVLSQLYDTDVTVVNIDGRMVIL